jgi:hypothetical protein
MKVTVDSSEPLTDALRVIGALYHVTLVVSEDEVGQGEPMPGTAAKSSSSTRKTTRATGAGKARTAKPKAKAGVKSPAPPSSTEVRSWARGNGFTVRDRGRVAAAVVAAYREEHNL